MTQKQAQVAEKKASGRRYLYLGVVLIIMLVAVALIVTQSKGAGISRTAYDNVVLSNAFAAKLNVPSSISNRIGIGTANYQQFGEIKNRPALILNGKPEVLYIGADYCPFCAAERWALIIALSRFGNFSNLHYMTSSASDYAPSTPTFTFYNSTYTSPYVSFVSVEQTTNQPTNSGSGYVQLQTLTAAETGLLETYDPAGSIPFILIANRSAISGANFDPLTVLGTANWTTILNETYNTSTLQSTSMMGAADLITEQICNADNNTPASVCGQPYVAQVRSLVG